MEIAEHASVLEPGLIAAYRAALYNVHAPTRFTLRIDQYSTALAAFLAESRTGGAMFITAWNPHGEARTRAHNDALQQRLVEDLDARGLRWLPAFGAHPDDPARGEVSVLAFGVSRPTAGVLGLSHAQNAVVWAGADAVPRLLLLR